jgi:hypothetical protein
MWAGWTPTGAKAAGEKQPRTPSFLPVITALPPGGSLSSERVEEEELWWLRPTWYRAISITAPDCILYTISDAWEGFYPVGKSDCKGFLARDGAVGRGGCSSLNILP